MTKPKKQKKVVKLSSVNKKAKEEPRERSQVFDGDILRGEYDEEYLKRNGLYERTVRRKARYWCFKMRHFTVDKLEVVPNCPEGFQEFIERLPGFAGWEHFAKSWDIQGGNPFMITLRLESVWQEWDHVMQRVAIPVDSPPQQINARMEALARDYAKNNK